jgi:hypothetical protein
MRVAKLARLTKIMDSPQTTKEEST